MAELSEKEKGDMWALMHGTREAVHGHDTRLAVVENTTKTIQVQFQSLVSQISDTHAKTESLLLDTNTQMTALSTDYHKRVGVKEFIIRWCIPICSLLVAVAAVVYSTSGQ